MSLNDLNKFTGPVNSTELVPVLFTGHGSPMNAIESNEFTDGFRNIAFRFPKPQAILCISAHWETRGTFVTAMENPATIHDFGGFPKALFEVQYPAPGSPELALETQRLTGNPDVGLTDKWGLDHGTWSVVRHMYPDADIPVVQMSLNYTQNPLWHYDLGRELSLLRRKGVLIIGSGNLVHNLRMVDWENIETSGFGYDWALEARDRMNHFILENDHQSLIHYSRQGRAVNLAVPTPDHFLPLLYILALKEEKESISLFNDKTVGGSLSMTSVFIN